MAACIPGHAQTADFEASSGYTAGSDISAIASWKQSAAGIGSITTADFHSGAQSLGIPSSNVDKAVSMGILLPKDGVVFTDVYVKPTADPSAQPLSTFDANGAVLGFVKSGEQGTVIAVTNPQTGASVSTGYAFSVDEQNMASDWIHITVREDTKAKTWDLFLDGQLVLIDQPITSAANGRKAAVAFYPSPAGTAFIDDLTITGVNPLFVDSDKDGIPDAVEIANGTDPFASDRDAMVYGESNIQHFLALEKGNSLKNALQGLPLFSRKVIYVDNVAGSDAGTGELSYAAAGRGPKASIQSALASADGTTEIAIVPTGRSYNIPAAILKGPGTLNLMPLGDVSITSTGE